MIYLICFVITTVITIPWINGIDYMKNNHPNYRGEDLFDEDIK